MTKVTVRQIEQIAATAQAAREALSAVVFGQGRAIQLALCLALTRGHGLIVGPPGVAKTRLALALAQVLGVPFNRVQGTPDLMPADITGTDIWDAKAGVFRFVPGPIFTGLLLMDEVNRASPRTQAAVLEAMQERAVTMGGTRHPLPMPFLVFATQNPYDSEGVYPLPEAQLDRFAAQIPMDFPSAEEEKRVLCALNPWDDTLLVKPLFTAKSLTQATQAVAQMPVGEGVVEAIVRLVRALRPTDTDSPIRWGPGPRGAQAVLALARATALMGGRLAPSLDDVCMVAEAALVHRMALHPYARDITPARLIQQALNTL